MGYIGSDPKTKESVSTSQLINDSVTNEKIVDDILFTSVTSSIVSASHITASSYQGGFDTGTSTRISGSLGANATTIRNLTSAGITGSFSPSSASFSTRTTTLEVASGSLSTRVTTNESDLTTLKGSGTVQGVSTGNTPTFAGVTVTGTLTAQEVHTEFESASIIFTSGSTKFGNTIDDTHQVTGSLLMTGSMAVGTGRGMSPNGLFEVGLNTDGTRRFSVSYEDSIVSLSAKNQSNNGENLKLMGDDVIIHTGTNTSGTERLRVTDGGHVSSSVNISIIKGNAMLNVEEIGGSKAYLFSGGAFTALRTTSNTPIHFGANYSSADDMFIDGSGKVGVNESSFSYTDYSVFHIKGRGSDDSNVTGMTFHVGGTNANSRNWSITTNNSAHGAMDFRVSEANNNTPNTNLVLKLQKESKISLSNNDSGTSNTIFGKNAGANLDAGSNYNTFIGEGVADASMNDATDNVGVGYQALSALTTGDDNVAVGMRALLDLENGNKNTGLGDSAGRSITSGEENVMVGYQAGDGITSGGANCIVGVNAAGAGNADYITAIGREAARDLNSTDANGTTAVGTNAIAALTSGQANTAVGFQTLKDCDVGDFNTAVGYQALKDFDPGSDGHGSNTAIGYRAGYSVDTAENNTFLGARAGEATTGGFNTMVGREAGVAATTTTYTTLIGHSAGTGIMTGNNNTCLGASAGQALTSGHNNVLVGAGTGNTLTSGANNTIIGDDADSEGTGTNRAVGIGRDIVAVEDYTTLGDGTDDIRASHGNTTWSTVSDKRFKKNIETSTAGLDFIEDLRPVTYNWKNKGEIPNWSRAYQEGSEEQYRNSKHNHGFIAQEVKEAIDNHPEIKDGFSMWYELEGSGGQQEVGETALIPVLVKAIQDLSQKIDNIEKKCKCMNE
tara:strand:+ start:1576 stop:4275 length:2700 start_codon:yes stop_codon:yes gene_type:complete